MAESTTVRPTNDIDTTQAPSVTITQASPEVDQSSTLGNSLAAPTTTTSGEMKEKTGNPTDSETALLNQSTEKGQEGVHASGPSTAAQAPVSAATAASTGRTSPLETLQRKLSNKASTGKSPAQPNAETTTSNASAVPNNATTAPAPLPQTSTTAASTSTSTPASKAAPTVPASKPAPASTSRSTPQKKKKKRKGLAGLLLSLGCLSANDFEDEDKKKAPAARAEMAQKPNTTSATKPVTATTTPPKPAVESKIEEPRSTGAVTSTDGKATPAIAAPVESDKGISNAAEAEPRSREAVVIAPVEPVTPPVEETAGLTSAAVQPPGSGSTLLTTPSRPHGIRRDSDNASDPSPSAGPTSSAEMDRTETSGGYTDISESDQRGDEGVTSTSQQEEEYVLEEEYEDEEDKLIAQGGMGIPLDENGNPAPLLPPMDKVHHGRKCLVLDLDETLLHSSFKMLPTADYIVPVEIESQTHNVYVIKRPGVDRFLIEMGKIYEIVVFTASLSKYADPVLDMLDTTRVVRHRLFRESCYNHKGNYVKDLSQLGRDMEGCIIIDNSPASYIFHPTNAVPVSTWFNDPHDTELTDLCPFLTDLATVEDIRGVLDGSI